MRGTVQALGHTAWITLLFYICQNLVLRWTERAGLGPDPSILVWCLPSVLLILATVLLTRRLRAQGWKESLAYLGFKAVTGQRLGLGFVLSVPVLVGYGEGYVAYVHKGFSMSLFPQWPFLLAWFLVGTFFEELVFRGFLFQNLRERWAFGPAALVSSFAWALAHFGNAFLGAHVRFLFPDILVFLLGLTGAYVFERSGNSILPWMMAHLAINLVGLVNIGNAGLFLTPLGAPIGYLFGGEILCLLIAVPVTRRLTADLMDRKGKAER
ncbi:MAG TPA: CPBP family intramembrane glutamic endopeptidase [bacterium]|nr:CPBP family intramembrane glutamic endopeptidase [bacterium]